MPWEDGEVLNRCCFPHRNAYTRRTQICAICKNLGYQFVTKSTHQAFPRTATKNCYEELLPRESCFSNSLDRNALAVAELLVARDGSSLAKTFLGGQLGEPGSRCLAAGGILIGKALLPGPVLLLLPPDSLQ